MSHPIEHLEIYASDRAAVAAFFAHVFDFAPQDFPNDNYTLVLTGEGSPFIALLNANADNPTGRVVPYFTTDDVAASLARANEAGGKTLMESTPIPNVGDVGVLTDPAGTVLGLWKPVGRQGGGQ